MEMPSVLEATSTTFSKDADNSLTTSAATRSISSQSKPVGVVSGARRTEQFTVTSGASKMLAPDLSHGSPRWVGHVIGASDEGPAIMRAPKRSYAGMAEQERDEDEASATHKVATTPSTPLCLQQDMTPRTGAGTEPQKLSLTTNLSRKALSMEPPRKRLAQSPDVTGIATSEVGATPSNAIDLTSSDHEPSPTPPEQQLESHLHRLPGELRNRIYEHVGLFGSRLDLRTLPEPALTIAYPSLKDELHSVIFSENKLRVPVYTHFRSNPPWRDPPKRSSSSSSKLEQRPRELKHGSGHMNAGIISIPSESWVMNVDPRFVVIKHICFRIMECEPPYKHHCDFFLNVKMSDGKAKATYLTLGYVSKTIKSITRHMSILAAARAKHFAAEEGFEGYNWDQAQQIADSFVNVGPAERGYHEKYGKVILN